MSPPAPLNDVLVVDDDDDTSLLLGIILDRHGWRTTCVTDLAQAERALATGAFSVLVTDLSLPDGSGLSLLSRGRAPALRAAFVMTGHGGDDARRESARLGFDALLLKPFDALELVGLLERHLAPSELAQDLLPGRMVEKR